MMSSTPLFFQKKIPFFSNLKWGFLGMLLLLTTTDVSAQDNKQYLENIYQEALKTKKKDPIDQISLWLRVYNEIDKNHPYFLTVNKNLAQLFYGEKLYDESIVYFKNFKSTIVIKNNDDIADYTKYASALSKTGQFEKSGEITNGIIKHHENNKQWIGVLNQLHILVATYNENKQYQKALQHNEEILNLLKEKNYPAEEIIKIYNNIGYNYEKLNQYQKAIDYYLLALKSINKTNQPDLYCTLLMNTGIVYYHLNNYNEQIKYFELAKAQADCNKGQVYLMLSNVFKNKQDFYKALLYAEMAEKFYVNSNNKELLADSYFILADVHNKLLNHQVSIDFYQKYLQLKEELDSELRRKKDQFDALKQTIEKTEKELKLLYIEQRNNQLTISGLKLEKEKDALYFQNLKLDTENKEKQLVLLKKEKQVKETELKNQLLKDQQIKQALLIEKQKLEVEASAKEKKLQRLELEKKDALLIKDKKEKELLIKDQEITKLEISKAKSVRQNMTIVMLLLVALLFSIYNFYRNKKKEHKKLSVAYTNLETSEKKVRTAEEKIKLLLSQQVSSEVAQHLIDSKEDSLAVETEACIVFIDVRNFTPTVRNKNPQEIIQFQNDLFAFMMDTIIQHKGIVNTFLGDGFMATFGAPVATGQDHIHAFEAIKSIINQLNDKIVSQNIEPVRIGVGVYAGNVIAGNVGSNTRKQYSVNGQPVIMASRLEQLNKEFGSCLIMSKTLFESLPDKDNYTPKYEWVSLKGLENQIEVAIFTENNLINI
jgi:class 3 adenylate cyclase